MQHSAEAGQREDRYNVYASRFSPVCRTADARWTTGPPPAFPSSFILFQSPQSNQEKEMSSSIRYRAAAALAAVALAACSDSLTQPTPSRQIASINSPSFVITPALSDVIVGSGTF